MTTILAQTPSGKPQVWTFGVWSADQSRHRQEPSISVVAIKVGARVFQRTARWRHVRPWKENKKEEWKAMKRECFIHGCQGKRRKQGARNRTEGTPEPERLFNEDRRRRCHLGGVIALQQDISLLLVFLHPSHWIEILYLFLIIGFQHRTQRVLKVNVFFTSLYWMRTIYVVWM